MLAAIIVVAIVLLAVLAFAASRPDTFRIERSTHIAAQPEQVFGLINDFHQWERWSPWAKVDPAMTATYSGAASGPGAAYDWSGNSKVGTGRMEIIASSASSGIVIKLDFLKPFEGHNTSEFTLRPDGAGTTVKWAMYGPQAFIPKLMGLVFSMEKMVGPQFVQGLATLKALAERQA